MRFLHVFLVVLAVVGAGVLLEASPIDEDNYAAYPLAQAEALLDVDGQGHANEGERLTRQFGFGGYRGGFGGYRGGYGGYRGGYGGYRGGYGGYRGGYGGYRGGYGGYRGGYGGYGGYRGGFYG